MNKKGNYADIWTFVEWFVVFVLVTGLVLMFMQNFNSNVQAQPNSTIPQEVKDISQNYTTSYPLIIDYIAPLVYFVFLAFSVMAARLIPSSPKFIFVAIFVMILITFATMMVENYIVAWFEQSKIGVAMATMTFTPYMINHLLFFVLFYTIAVSIALLSKESGQQ